MAKKKSEKVVISQEPRTDPVPPPVMPIGNPDAPIPQLEMKTLGKSLRDAHVDLGNAHRRREKVQADINEKVSRAVELKRDIDSTDAQEHKVLLDETKGDVLRAGNKVQTILDQMRPNKTVLRSLPWGTP